MPSSAARPILLHPSSSSHRLVRSTPAMRACGPLATCWLRQRALQTLMPSAPVARFLVSQALGRRRQPWFRPRPLRRWHRKAAVRTATTITPIGARSSRLMCSVLLAVLPSANQDQRILRASSRAFSSHSASPSMSLIRFNAEALGPQSNAAMGQARPAPAELHQEGRSQGVACSRAGLSMQSTRRCSAAFLTHSRCSRMAGRRCRLLVSDEWRDRTRCCIPARASACLSVW